MAGIALDADLSLAIGDAVAEAVKAGFDSLHPQDPRPVRFQAVGVADSSTYTVVDCQQGVGNVPAGRFWDLRRLSITAAGVTGDPFTTLAGASAIIVIAQAGYGTANTSTLAGAYQLLEPAAVVPNSVSYARNQVTLHPGERLFVIVKGLSTTNQVSVAGQFESFETSTYYES